LLARVWADTFVEEGILSVNVAELRRALGEQHGSHRYIETVPRRGYRFIADVKRVAVEDFSRNGDDRDHTQMLVKEPIVARGKPITSLAVLPFVNVSANSEANYLSDGITESIINNLSQLPQLLILASSTVFRYKERTGEPLEVGLELRVRTVLVGRILELEGKLIVRTELINVADGSQLWGAQYGSRSSDLLRVQAEISSEISERLLLHLTGPERKQMAKRHTDDIEAYHLYLKGRYYWNKRTPDDLQKGIDYFRQAIDRDPAYALAYAGIADCYNFMGYIFGRLRPEEAMSKARTAALKALEIDGSLAEAHAALALVKFMFEWDWAGAERYFGKAIALNPGYAPVRHIYSAYLATVLRRFDEAIAEANRALELDPLSLPINHIVALLSLFAGEVDRAIEQFEKTLEIDPRFPMAHKNLGYAFERKGMRERAVEEFLMAKQFEGVDARELDAFRQAFVTAGWKGYVAKELAAALARWEEQNHWHGDAYSVARHYARLGDHDNALRWLESAYELRSGMLIWLEIEPHFEPLRPDPRFQDISRRVGLRT
jgi:TolB-like protein